MPAETVENRLFADIQIGDTAQLTRTVTAEDIDHYAAASGDFNPSHVDQAYAEERQMGRRVAHSLWGVSLFSSLLGNVLPGPGTVYRSQILDFHRPLYLGDSLTVIVTAIEKRPDLQSVLFARGETLEPLPTAVAHPCDSSSLIAAVEAAKARFIVPILIGPKARIQAVAAAEELDISGLTLVDVPHSHAAADKAVELARAGEVELIMKGSLHTDELLTAGGPFGHRSAYRAPAQPCLHHGRAYLFQTADRHRCRHQHLPYAGRQAGYLPERHRPRPQSRHRPAQGSDPVGGRDGAYQYPLHGGSVRPLQDGRSRPDHRCDPGWATGHG